MGSRPSVLIAAIILGFAALSGACGTLLGISPDSPPDATDAGGSDGSDDLDAAPTRATGGPCIFDDAGSKFSDVCGFGP